MRKSVKIAIATAFAGLVAAGGAAFTATGLNQAPSTDQFIGGTVTQTVHGATLDGVVYHFSDATHNVVDGMTVTFSDAAGETASVNANGHGDGVDYAPALLGVVQGDGTVVFTAVDGGLDNLTSVDITVADSLHP